MQATAFDSSDFKSFIARIAQYLREGSLTLKNVAGLAEEEMEAVEKIAVHYRRRGNLADAIAIYSLLLTYDRLKIHYWQTMADLQCRSGQHLLSIACDEVSALLGGRNIKSTHRQIVCLEQLGKKETAQELLELSPVVGIDIF